ncbi:MAG: acetyl-CoA C-acyltransferase, partial [Xanthomonadales bacterium]|nr:acetyl-CoA C-acyltransferase [Xanthomonadales bacterium]
MSNQIRRIAVIGGSRIPFCRSNSIFSEKTNLDMLAAVLQGVTDRFGLDGKQLDEVVAGAVTSHSKDWNLAREALLSTSLSPLTPGITLQQACGTSLQSALMIGAKIATGQIECGIAAGTDTTSDAPISFGRKFSQRLVKLGAARAAKQRMAAFKGFRPAELKPVLPANGEPRTGMSMGQHCERMAQEWKIPREEQDRLAMESHQKAARA